MRGRIRFGAAASLLWALGACAAAPAPSGAPVPTATLETSTTASMPAAVTGSPGRSSATANPPAPQQPGVVSVLPTGDKVVALTFDGGADSRGAEAILATLGREGVPASFFVTGRFAAAYPQLVARLSAVGPVGNHSWDHPQLPGLTDAAVRSQLVRTRTQIIAVTGQDPVPLFRFPFGASDARTRALVAAQGYLAVGWTVDSLGWKGTSGGQSVAAVVARVVAAARPGEIVLMHLGANPDDDTTLDADALPQIVAALRAKGFGFVTLDRLR